MKCLDLFCGAAGGWSLGMHRAGYTTVAACEIDPWRRAVYSHNFPDARMYEDVREVTAAGLVRDLGALPDIIVGSPPCQDASTAARERAGVDGARTGLFFEAAERWRVGRACLAAYGDAVVPQITEAIVRAVVRTLEDQGRVQSSMADCGEW